MLSRAQRVEIEQHVAAVEALCERTPANGAEWEGATHMAVAKLMLALPSSQQNDLAIEALWEAHRAALEDVPHWAVEDALRQWYRGECGLNERGQPYDYRWRPAPAELRRVSLRVVWRLKSLLTPLRGLLAAERREEFDAEHCERMRKKFSALSMALRGGMSAVDAIS